MFTLGLITIQDSKSQYPQNPIQKRASHHSVISSPTIHQSNRTDLISSIKPYHKKTNSMKLMKITRKTAIPKQI